MHVHAPPPGPHQCKRQQLHGLRRLRLSLRRTLCRPSVALTLLHPSIGRLGLWVG